MRDYSKVGPKFWIGATGKRLRAAGMEAQIVAMYLMTSPHANMLGLYYCPTMFIAHETGLGLEGASKGLQCAIEAGFCEYDEGSEVVWVIEMASYQVGEALKPNDLRVKGVQNEYASLPENPFLARFFKKYDEAFCMAICRGAEQPKEAPSKPLRSQEQEQEQEKEQEKVAPALTSTPQVAAAELLPAVATATPPAKAARADTALQIACRATWEAYSAAYAVRYGAAPVRAARQSAQVKQIVQALGAEESPPVAAWFVDHPAQWYVTKGHDIGLLLADLTKLRTEWATGRVVTTTAARQSDRRGAMASAVQNLLAECEGAEK